MMIQTVVSPLAGIAINAIRLFQMKETIIMTNELPKFNLAFRCPKCGSDKCGTRLAQAPETDADRRTRERLKWPPGELMVQTCQICGHVQISRPLDYQETLNG